MLTLQLTSECQPLTQHLMSHDLVATTSLYARTTGREMSLSALKGLEIKAAQELYNHPADQLIAGMQVGHIEQLTESIEKIEKVVLASARELPNYAKLATL